MGMGGMGGGMGMGGMGMYGMNQNPGFSYALLSWSTFLPTIIATAAACNISPLSCFNLLQTYINSIKIEKPEGEKDLFPYVSIGFITLTTVGITIHFIGKSIGEMMSANENISDLNTLNISREDKTIDESHLDLIGKIHSNALYIFSSAKNEALKNLVLRVNFTSGSIIIAVGAIALSKPLLIAGGLITTASVLGMIIKEGMDKIYDYKFIHKINKELGDIDSFIKILDQKNDKTIPPSDSEPCQLTQQQYNPQNQMYNRPMYNGNNPQYSLN